MQVDLECSPAHYLAGQHLVHHLSAPPRDVRRYNRMQHNGNSRRHCTWNLFRISCCANAAPWLQLPAGEYIAPSIALKIYIARWSNALEEGICALLLVKVVSSLIGKVFLENVLWKAHVMFGYKVYDLVEKGWNRLMLHPSIRERK